MDSKSPFTGSLFEALESRRLLAGDASVVQSLPFVLEFDRSRAGVLDKDGQGTGLTLVQANRTRNEYQPGLIDLRTGAGVLNITSSGNASAGGNFEADNTLTNGLETQFNASTGTFTITARLRGPLTQLDRPVEQGGIMFGPDQENYIKLVALATSSGAKVHFLDEQKTSKGYRHQLPDNLTFDLPAFSTIQTLDLVLTGNAASRSVTAAYRVNGGALTQLPAQVTLDADKGGAFFSSKARAGLIVMHKNNVGPVTVSFDRFEITGSGTSANQPNVTATRPANGATNVSRDTFVAADVNLPNSGQGVDTATLTSSNVKLYRTSDGAQVTANLNTSGGGDSIVLTPLSILASNTNYTFEVSSGVKDLSGASFKAFKSTFTTGTAGGTTDPSIAFQKVGLPTATNQNFSGVTIGPDGKLYATTLTGHILRYTISGDGSLSTPQVISSVIDFNGGARFVTGLAFDPTSTASNLIAWISHGQAAFEDADDFTGKISRLSGSNLQNYDDAVVNLPRSVRDHLTNQLTFGPDGKLYVVQGSNSAMGAPDSAWDMRNEHPLNAAVLVADAKGLKRMIDLGLAPFDVKTTDAGGPYDPLDPEVSKPVALYATGVRNAYDLVWHTNGKLYVPTNGSAGGGSTPATPSNLFSERRIDFKQNGAYEGPEVPGIDVVATAQPDYLYQVVSGGYYGHPNPSRSEYVMNGGNPTSGTDKNEVSQYPVGTLPDRNYRGSAYTIGTSYAPAGILEYKGNAFGGKLKGSLLMVRYSGGDDVIALKVGANGAITDDTVNITGLTHFDDPVDIAEDPSTGNLYVVEYGAEKITLVKPVEVGATPANIKPNKTRLIYGDPRGGGASESQRVTISNTGGSTLTISNIALGGESPSHFTITSKPSTPVTLAPGGKINVDVAFDPSSGTTAGIMAAYLVLSSNDGDEPVKNVRLRGLATTGLEGPNEPSLQRIMDLYEIGVDVGDSNGSDSTIDWPLDLPNDEVAGQRFVKAGAGPVTISPLALYGVHADPAVQFGYYEPGTPASLKTLFDVETDDFQSVSLTTQGATSFDPGSSAFGLFGVFPEFKEADGSLRTVFSEHALNFFETDPARTKHMLVFPYKSKTGAVVPNTFVVAFEEVPSGLDFQDFVAVVSNVKVATSGPEIGLDNLDRVPGPDRMIFNKIRTLNPNVPNVVHSTAKMRLRNTGDSTLRINSLSVTGPFKVTNPASLPKSIAAGGYLDVTIQFTATSAGANDGLYIGSLAINSNDADEATRTVQLAGFWQRESENQQEPTLNQLVQVFGYNTVITYPGQTVTGGGKVESVGDEILSPYWQRVNGNLPVSVRQLAAFHTQGETATLSWFKQGSTSFTEIFTHAPTDSQSLLPRNSVSGSALRTFTPASSTSQVFGFKIEEVVSDPTKNPQEQPGGGHGHAIRFFPVRNNDGSYVPNTFLMVMDYPGVNYDYNDNVYLVSNVKPATFATPPTNLAAFGNSAGVTLDWADAREEDDIAGYYVYRSYKPTSGFVRFKTPLLTSSSFKDTTAEAGRKAYYRVISVGTNGSLSLPITTTATRPA